MEYLMIVIALTFVAVWAVALVLAVRSAYRCRKADRRIAKLLKGWKR